MIQGDIKSKHNQQKRKL